MTAQILMNESVLRSNLTLPYGFASQREKASQNNKVEFKRILVTKLKMNNNKHGEKLDQFNDPHKLLPKLNCIFWRMIYPPCTGPFKIIFGLLNRQERSYTVMFL